MTALELWVVSCLLSVFFNLAEFGVIMYFAYKMKVEISILKRLKHSVVSRFSSKPSAGKVVSKSILHVCDEN